MSEPDDRAETKAPNVRFRSLGTKAAFGILALLILASTGHRFASGFVYDDIFVIEEGTVIHDPSKLGTIFMQRTMFAASEDNGQVQSVDTYRPIPIALFMWDASLSGHDPWSYHLTNLLLHIANAWLLYLLGIALLGRSARLPVLYGAAFFAMHPWLVEAHVWINGRSDPLALLFGQLTLLSTLRAERIRLLSSTAGTRVVWWRVLAGACFFVGLLSKEVLLLLGPVFVFLPNIAGGRVGSRRTLRAMLRGWSARALPIGLASVVYLIARGAVLGGMATHKDPAQLWAALLNVPWLLADALGQTVWPRGVCLRSLSDEYREVPDWQRTVAFLSLLVLAGGAFWLWRRGKAAGAALLPFSLAFFIAPLLPVAVITTVLWPGFGRYLYLPVAGMAIAVMTIADQLRRRRGVRPTILVVGAFLHIVVLGAGAAVFTGDFRDDEHLYGAVRQLRPNSAIGLGFLGFSRARQGDHARAVPLLLQAAEMAPGEHRYLARAGFGALELGNRPLAAQIAELGIERFHGRGEEAAYHLIALNSMNHRDPEEAVFHMVRCLEVYPYRPDCLAALRDLVGASDLGGVHRGIAEHLLSERPRLREQLRHDLFN